MQIKKTTEDQKIIETISELDYNISYGEGDNAVIDDLLTKPSFRRGGEESNYSDTLEEPI